MSVKQPFYSTISIDTFFFFLRGGGIRNRHKTRFKQLNHEGESLENIHEVVVLPLVDDNLNNNVQYI